MKMAPASVRASALLIALNLACAIVPAQEPDAVSIPRAFANAARMTERAGSFLALLSAEQRESVLFALDSNERGNWSNLPNVNLPNLVVSRSGLRLGDLTEAQRIAVHDLLRASMSSQGYLKAAGVMHMDQVLRDTFVNPPEGLMGIDVGGFDPGPVFPDGVPDDPSGVGDSPGSAEDVLDTFGTGNYYISIFGLPEPDHEWAWLLGGHHLAASFTVSGGRVAFTPLFLGSQPLIVRRGIEAGWSPLYHESHRGFDLMESLTPEQQKVALVSEERVYDVIAGPGGRSG